MKLINRTLIYYFLIGFPLLVVAGVFSYYIIRNELRDSTDELLVKEQQRAIQVIQQCATPHNINLTYDSLSTITISNQRPLTNTYIDTSIYNASTQEYSNYRIYTSGYSYHNTYYIIRVAKTNFEEEELLEGLFSAIGVLLLCLLMSFAIGNWLIVRTVWNPFYTTLARLNDYDVKQHNNYLFTPQTIIEFDTLNNALNKMIQKIHTDYSHQKEFTENAAHEMQTPLAVIKAKVNLLMQSSAITEVEMQQLQTIEYTIHKLTMLNKALLLLSKIENNQYHSIETIAVSSLINKALETYADHLQAKNIIPIVNCVTDFSIHINPTLADILLNNLLQNAIRHNAIQGKLIITMHHKTLVIANEGEALTLDAKNLFKRFVKNDASKDSLGLGLAIVKSITNNYLIEVEYSYINQLHTFTLKF